MSFCLTGDPNDINVLYLKTLSIPKIIFITVINLDNTPFPLKITFYTIYGSIPLCRSDTVNIGCFYFKNKKLNYLLPPNSWHAQQIRTLNFISNYPLGCLLVFTPSFFSHFHLSF